MCTGSFDERFVPASDGERVLFSPSVILLCSEEGEMEMVKKNDFTPTALEIKCIVQNCECDDQDETHK